MKKPKVIRFRCYCMECTNDDKPGDSISRAATAELDQNDINANESNPQLIADSLERLLFGA